MLRKLLTTAGVGALVAMAIGGASLASASGDESGGRTIRGDREDDVAQKFLDLGKPGPTAGDARSSSPAVSHRRRLNDAIAMVGGLSW